MIVVAALAGADGAAAQGFFQQLFGIGSSGAVTVPQSRPSPLLTPGGRPYAMPSQSQSPRHAPDSDDDRDNRSSKVKTVCVRMCDGYFFPVSNSTSRRGIYRDQMKCRAACGDDARLFHMPVGSTDVSEANDGQGRIYGLLAVAYKYKKATAPGCQCRPAPWSEAELARHAQYAEVDAEKLAAERAANARLAAADKTIGEKATEKEQADAADPIVRPERANAAPGKLEKTIKIAAAGRPANTGKSSSQTRRTPALPALALATGKPTQPAAMMGLGASKGYAWPGDAPRR